MSASPGKTGCPIRADMATVINTPTGIAESAALYGSPARASAHSMERRKNLTKMLAKRLQQEHGADAVRVALIQGVLDAFGPLQRGDTITPADLALLERNVKGAVQAVGSDARDIMPAERWPRPRRDFARDLSHVADWTAVSKHRSGFYLVEQQRELAERERKKEELSACLAHQRSEEEARKRDRLREVQHEAKQLQELEADHKAELAAAAAKKRNKMQKFSASINTQIEQRRARAAVGTRLRQLEDEQTIREHREEQQLSQQKMAQRALEMAAQNEATERHNEANQQQRRAQLQAEREADLRLNRQAVELMERKEKEREQGIADLKARIESSQRAYENKAGAVEKARNEAEETNRLRWEASYERKLKEKEEARAKHRLQGLLQQAASIDQQIQIHQARRAQRMEENRQNGEEIRLAAVAFEEAEKQKRARQMAKELENQQALIGQIAARNEAQANKNAMTALEATLNRDLLLSIASGKGYEPTSILD